MGWHASGVKKKTEFELSGYEFLLVKCWSSERKFSLSYSSSSSWGSTFVFCKEVDLTRPALSEFSSCFWITSDKHSIVYVVEPPLINNLYLSTTATSLQQQLLCVPEDSPYIGSCLYLSTTATATKECHQTPKQAINKGQFFQRLAIESRMDRKFDQCDASMIARGKSFYFIFD